MALTLNDILNRIGSVGQAKFRRLAKKAFDLGWEEHSNKIMAAKLLAYSNTMKTGQTKNRMKIMAAFILAHDEMCYSDFIDYFDNVLGWYPDPDLHNAIVDCFKDSRVLKLYMKFGGNRYGS